MKNIVFFGAPATGKGTLARYLSAKHGWDILSTGHIFRTKVQTDSRYRKFKEMAETAKIFSDEIAIELVENFLDDNKEASGMIFDGCPRSGPQSPLLENMLIEKGENIDYIFLLDLPEEEIFKRIEGRYSCRECDASYNDLLHPTKEEGICDDCASTNLYRRTADSRDLTSKRLEEYNRITGPAIDFFAKRDNFYRIDASLELDEVKRQIDEIINLE